MMPVDFISMSRWVFIILLAAGIGACVTSEQQQEDEAENRSGGDASFPVQQSLAPDAGEARTIQLYQAGDQSSLPLIRLRDRDQLSLEFDLLGRDGRPLSIYFYHASREWERDLSAAEYMKSYQRDELLDYESSRATQQPYVHYEYAFPNDDIGFDMSGNYILRVTEQGNEDAVLFERNFFISEQSASIDLRLRRQRIGTGSLPGFQPILLFQPPEELANGSIFDYNTCFVPNGRFSEARCTSRPESQQQDALRFNLDPRRSFQVEGASYGLDLDEINVGGDVLEVDQSTTPPSVWLEADDARFPGASGNVALTGQTVLGTGGNDVDLYGEYVRAFFHFVPPEQSALRREVYLAGSFNGWRPTGDHTLTWQPSERRYEGEVLLKQGQYAYRYVSEDSKLRNVLRETLPQTRNRFTALVYYHDSSLRTDRLLSVQQTLVE